MVVRCKAKHEELDKWFVNADKLKVEPLIKKISDIEPGKNNRLIVEVNRKGTVKEFTSKKGYPCRVCKVEVVDDSGTMELVLFNGQIGLVAEGDKLELINTDLDEFNGEKSIKVGKFGHLINKGPATKNTQMKFREVNQNGKIKSDSLQS